MAGTSWDKLGLMNAAFEIAAPAIRRVGEAEGLKLSEFHRDDPVWRLSFARAMGGEAVIDVAWMEERPDTYAVTAAWWIDDYDSAVRRMRSEEVGEFRRDQATDELEQLLHEALGRIDSWTESDLDQRSGPYPDWRTYQTREDFYRVRLPVR
jgi:hypothetical protein